MSESFKLHWHVDELRGSDFRIRLRFFESLGGRRPVVRIELNLLRKVNLKISEFNVAAK